MRIESELFGTTKIGTAVERWTLESAAGVTARVISFGATLQSLRAPGRDGQLADIVLGFDELASYEGEHPYFGATIGRCANRIARGRFRLDGSTYELAQNNGENHIHGGAIGFDKVVWAARTLVEPGAASVRFSHVSPHGDEGYPGELTVAVTYTLDDDGRLTIDYDAQTDRATVINLTNHSYWNLAGAGSGEVYDHETIISAAYFLPVDAGLIPTGELRSVEGTPFDFTATRTIGERIGDVEEGGYDHCFVLATRRHRVPQHAATVRDPTSGRVLRVSTTEPGIQFYTANSLDSVRGASGQTFDRHGAFCLEAQLFPDSPNQTSFPSCILRPDSWYRQRTVHELGVE